VGGRGGREGGREGGVLFFFGVCISWRVRGREGWEGGREGGVGFILGYAWLACICAFSLYQSKNVSTHKYVSLSLYLSKHSLTISFPPSLPPSLPGIPGMVAGMIRHLHSLRRMKRDHGWIHTLLEEAENERMHLLTFMRLKRPGSLFRLSVLVVQGVFFNGAFSLYQQGEGAGGIQEFKLLTTIFFSRLSIHTVFFLSYLINPKICHRLVGHIEEEAVKTVS